MCLVNKGATLLRPRLRVSLFLSVCLPFTLYKVYDCRGRWEFVSLQPTGSVDGPKVAIGLILKPSGNGIRESSVPLRCRLLPPRGSTEALVGSSCRVHLSLATEQHILFQHEVSGLFVPGVVRGVTKVESNVRVHLAHLEAELVAQCRVLCAAKLGR